MMQMNRSKLCRFLNIIIYFIVLLFFVNMADEHLRLIGVGLPNLCVYTFYDFLLFNGEFKMRHNIILLIDIQGELYHIFTQHHYVVH